MKVTEIHEFYNSDHEDASNVIVNITDDMGEEFEYEFIEEKDEE